MRSPFFDRISRIDNIIAKGPTKCDFRSDLEPLFLEEASINYFYEKIDDINWIDLLEKAGKFESIPPPIVDTVNKTTSFPRWPETILLVRFAKEYPEKVLRVLVNIRETANTFAITQLAEAALLLPSDLSAIWIEKQIPWLRNQEKLGLFLPEKLTKLICTLVRNEETSTAIDAAAVLLGFLPDTQEKQRGLKREPRLRIGDWDYKKSINDILPVLTKKAGIEALVFVSDLLNEYLNLSRGTTDTVNFEDNSSTWRPAIENHTQNIRADINTTLVSRVRDIAVQLIDSQQSTIREVLATLEKYRWLVFRRIILYILSRFPQHSKEITISNILNRDNFDNFSLLHEYSLLLNVFFDELDKEQRNTFLSWIERGPTQDDLDSYREFRKARTRAYPDEDEMSKYIIRWKTDKLALIEKKLPPDWMAKYNEFKDRLDYKPEHPNFASYIEEREGPVVPKELQDLQTKEFADIFEYLRTWTPTTGFMSLKRNDVGLLIARDIASTPEKYVRNAILFKELHNVYTTYFFFGLYDAIKNNMPFEWPLILDLCRWAVQQVNHDQETDKVDAEEEVNWSWTRKNIARVFSEALSKDLLPYSIKDDVLGIILLITDDLNPDTKDEESYNGTDIEALPLFINTTRGEALNAVIEYALWIRRYFDKQPDAKQPKGKGLNIIPEVRSILENHLDITKDPSYTIRTVYGWWFPWLVLLDNKWAKKNVEKIFPREADKSKYFIAAWETYLFHCSPYNDVFGVLRDYYSYAVDQLVDTRKKEGKREANNQLAEHIMAYCWRGKVNFDDSDEILARFFKNASPKIRGHAMDFAGRTLLNTKGDLDKKILERFIALWQNRLSEARESRNQEAYKDEMEAFGWWFESKKFDTKWSLDQLYEALKIARKIEFDDSVVDRLVKLAKEYPRETVLCLSELAHGDIEGFEISSWSDDAKKILETALEKDDQELVSISLNLVDYFGSRGYIDEFRDLWDKNKHRRK